MGYTIEYSGQFYLNKPLTKKLAKYLLDFSKTRHFKRNVEGFGAEGEFFIDPYEKKINFWNAFQKYNKEGLSHSEILKVLAEKHGIIDYNRPPVTQPGLWCQWVPTEDRLGIEWDGNEKFYNAVDWLNYIIKNFLIPKGYILNGTVTAKYCLEEYDHEDAKLCVTNNKLEIF